MAKQLLVAIVVRVRCKLVTQGSYLDTQKVIGIPARTGTVYKPEVA